MAEIGTPGHCREDIGERNAASPAVSLPMMDGDPLEDRIRFGLEESVATRTGMAVQLARLLADWNAKGIYHEDLCALHVLVSADNQVSLSGPQTNDESRLEQSIHQFGWILFQLLTGRVEDLACEKRLPNLDELYRAGMPPALIKVVEDCTASPPRLATFSRVVRALETVGKAPGQTSSNPQLTAILILGCLAGLTAILWILVR
ncbi:MAG: hypothetical protein HY820_02720 [Acidobacteria bacterium]|nr:hypothetical protein [Acidobacteriota bacterium]